MKRIIANLIAFLKKMLEWYMSGIEICYDKVEGFIEKKKNSKICVAVSKELAESKFY